MTDAPTKAPQDPERDPERAQALPPAEAARRRAAAYLDLWERHVVQLAVGGADAPPRMESPPR